MNEWASLSLNCIVNCKLILLNIRKKTKYLIICKAKQALKKERKNSYRVLKKKAIIKTFPKRCSTD